MAALTVSEVKTLLLIPANNTKYDDYLTTLIPMIESFVKQYCNRDFIDPESEGVNYPDGLKIVMAQLIRYHIKETQIQLEAIRTNNNTMLPLYPPDLLTALNQWRRIRYVAFKKDIL